MSKPARHLRHISVVSGECWRLVGRSRHLGWLLALGVVVVSDIEVFLFLHDSQKHRGRREIEGTVPSIGLNVTFSHNSEKSGRISGG